MTSLPVEQRNSGRAFAPWTDPAARPLVQFEGVGKRFGSVAAVEALTLDIFEGEFFALLGPSGCGKTTLLRLLAGFETPDAGRILLDGKDLAGVPPHRRPVNMMFQSYALFPHLTVANNVAFGLKQEGLPKDEIAARVAEMLALVKLDGYGARKPHQLSGGQRQRVALARALVKRPRVLLLDEPLAALDKKLRGETQFELMHLREKLGLTFVIVTHDQDEAMTVAHRIAVMHEGRLAQVATPADLYEQPNSCWVARFVGDVNLIEGRIVEPDDAGHVRIDSALGLSRVLRARTTANMVPGDRLYIALRPEKVRVSRDLPPPTMNSIEGEVREIAYLGDISVYKVRLDNGFVMQAAAANVTRDQPVKGGDRVWLGFAPDACVLLTG